LIPADVRDQIVTCINRGRRLPPAALAILGVDELRKARHQAENDPCPVDGSGGTGSAAGRTGERPPSGAEQIEQATGKRRASGPRPFGETGFGEQAPEEVVPVVTVRGDLAIPDIVAMQRPNELSAANAQGLRLYYSRRHGQIRSATGPEILRVAHKAVLNGKLGQTDASIVEQRVNHGAAIPEELLARLFDEEYGG
jgi:hypothetical protein